ncbi:MAG: NAD(P)-dependent oxidoreductase [bacterium]
MISNVKKLLHNTSRYPTSLIVRGSDSLGIELAKSLLDQGGFVILIDSEENGKSEQLNVLKDYKLLTILDFSAITILEEDLRRLDYVFYLQHKSVDLIEKISTQEFLQFSNYLDTILDLTAKFEAKFLLTTSLQAHQLILANKQDDFNFDAGVEEKHTIYSELEIQRYAESLVREYQDKVGIDARTLRLGELLGKNIEINYHSHLTKAIIQALRGQEIILPGDGLETEYYIHYLDAAYGILKAQFSLNTKGNIYTLANEEEISLLSIAYKLLDIIATAIDVGFTTVDDQLPPLKLHKMVPNLSVIGWKPRVTFERALTQTIDSIREALVSNAIAIKINEDRKTNQDESTSKINESKSTETKVKKKTRSWKQKIHDFFYKTETIVETEEPAEGALARLITARKLQDSSRKGSVIMANNKLREKISGKKIFGKSPTNFFRMLFDYFGEKFNILKRVTLADFVFSILGIIAFIILYFLILSPFLSLGKNLFLIKINLDAAEKAISAYNIQDSQAFCEKIKLNSINAQKRLAQVEFIFNLTGQKNFYNNSQDLLTNFSEYTSGFDEVLTSLAPMDEYFKHFEPGVKFTYSNSNLLTFTNQQNFEQLLGEINYSQNLIGIGEKRIAKTQPLLLENINNSPGWIQKLVKGKISKLDQVYSDNQGIIPFYQSFPDLLGNKISRRYLFVMEDNARFTASGGKIAGFVELEISEGAIKNIKVTKKSELNLKVTNISDQTLQKINLLSNAEINKSNVTLDSLSYLNDQQEYYQAVNDYYSSLENERIDLVFFVNDFTLEKYLENSGLTFQQIKISNDNLLSSINLLMGNKRSDEVRSEISLQIFSLLLEQEFNQIKDNYPEQIKIFAELAQAGNLRVFSKDSTFSSLLKKDDTYTLFDDYISFGVNSDSKTLVVEKYPSTNVEIKINISKTLETKKEIKLDLVGVDSYENAYICLPLGSKNISYFDVENQFVSPAFSDSQVCNLFIQDNNYIYGVKYETVSLNDNLSSGYTYNLWINKVPGIDSNYYLEIEFAPEIQVEALNSSYSRQDGKYIYSGVFESNQLNLQFKLK